MRLVLNVLWLVLAGFWMVLGYLVAAALCVVFVVPIPFAVAALRIGLFALWPFGRTVVKRPSALVRGSLAPFGRDIVPADADALHAFVV